MGKIYEALRDGHLKPQEALEKIDMIIGTKSDDPIAQALQPLIDIIRHNTDNLHEGREHLSKYDERFKKEDDERSKKERRSKAENIWNKSLEIRGDKKDALEKAAAFVRTKRFEDWKAEGYPEDSLQGRLEDELEQFMEICEKQGRDPATVVEQIAKERGYTPEEAEEAGDAIKEHDEKNAGENRSAEDEIAYDSREDKEEDKGGEPENKIPPKPGSATEERAKENTAEDIINRSKDPSRGGNTGASKTAKGMTAKERIKYREEHGEKKYKELLARLGK